jgi:hypothetical protein
MTISRYSCLPLFAVALASCSQKVGDEDLICNQTPGFIQGGATNSDQQLEITKSCIHKWAYRLGRSAGPNTEIAKATIGACREALDYFLDFKVKEGNESKEPFTDQKWQFFVKEFDEMALFRVVQGRAGQCSIRGVDQK